jgi:hypothetical protein
MGKILPFRKSEEVRTRRVDDTPAEVVIFPGIRIEYHDGTPAPEGNGRPRRRRRKGSADGALSA